MPARQRHRLWISLLPALAMSATLPASQAAGDQARPDPRLVYTAQSPDWLGAVGKLRVPGIKWREGRRTHHREDCSATLVAAGARNDADIIITAWHCLEFYSDLSQAITFTLFPDSDQPISSEAYRLADGGGMHADWAILKLHQPVARERVSSMNINPGVLDVAQNIVMAGYSSDRALGQAGKHLTYDPDCRVTRQSAGNGESDCLAYKGASGGAVVQLSADGKAWLSGVISQGDGATLSTFVPVTGFRSAIRRHLN